MDMDTEDEEEVILLVELTGLPNSSDAINACKDTCTILGLDSAEPVLQLDKYLFKGSYQDILGTAMIFEQVKGKKLNYVCKTNKKLAMSRVVLKSKEQPVVLKSKEQPAITKHPHSMDEDTNLNKPQS